MEITGIFNRIIVAAGLAALMSAPAFSASLPSAKSSTAISDTTLIQSTTETHSWDPIMFSFIKVAQQKELVFDVSLECGLFTDTYVKSKGGKTDTSTAEASVDVRVMLQRQNSDGTFGAPFAAMPGESGVTYCKRYQELMAKFQGIFQQCAEYDASGECIAYSTDTCLITEGVDTDNDGFVDDYTTSLDLECLDEEEVRLVLDTLNANAFNFVAPNLDSGVYRVSVEAEISSNTSAESGSAEARGLIGRGSMVVDETRFVTNDYQ
jgi:hypothetical protein